MPLQSTASIRDFATSYDVTAASLAEAKQILLRTCNV